MRKRIGTKRQHQVYFVVGPDEEDLNGERIGWDEQDILEQLRDWQDGKETPLPLTLYSSLPAEDDIPVFIDNLQISRIQTGVWPFVRRVKYLCSATLVRV